MARKPRSLDDAAIADLAKPRKGKRTYTDTDQRGLYVRVTAKGARAFWVVTRDLNKKQVWQRLGDTAIGVDAARAKARAVIKAIAEGTDRGGTQSFQAVSEQWFKRYVEAQGLRSASEIRRYLDKHLLPAWGGRDFTSIRRIDVANLLDAMEDDSGPVAADKALAVISKLCNWYATRHEKYQTPLVRGMRRSSPKDRARDRVLSDDELRAVWSAASANGTFGAFVRVALLTAQRRDKVASMKWSDVSVDGTWTIPAEDREKGNAGDLVLPEMALEIIRKQPRLASNEFVFAGRGNSHLSGYSKAKAAFDAKVQIPQWQLHDLRRTARSLMSRAGVNSDHRRARARTRH